MSRRARKTDLDDLRRLASAGDTDALFKLGLIYSKGEGVERDDRQALEWLRAAAARQHPAATALLGTRYEYGEGVEQDLEEALRLYRVAAEVGSRFAAERVEALTGGGDRPEDEGPEAKRESPREEPVRRARAAAAGSQGSVPKDVKLDLHAKIQEGQDRSKITPSEGATLHKLLDDFFECERMSPPYRGDCIRKWYHPAAELGAVFPILRYLIDEGLCPACHGTGESECDLCKGTGTDWPAIENFKRSFNQLYSRYPGHKEFPCGRCGGRGFVCRCSNCHDSGWL